MPRKIVIPAKYKKYTPRIIMGVLLLILSLTSFYFYKEYKKVTTKVNGVAELRQITSNLSKMMLLPQESPTLATVADKSKLDSQDFYKNAQNGDKILLYNTAKKAILYRPSTNMIIEVASIAVKDETALNGQKPSNSPTNPQASAAAALTTTKAPTPATKPATVTIYNGTKTSGLAAQTESKIKTIPNITVLSKTNSTLDYEKTILVDLTGTNKATLESIQKNIGGSIVSFPEGEKKPASDILIIVGADFVK